MSDLGNKEIFAKNLKYYMELNHKDRNDVCRDLEIPYTTFAEWYNGNIYPRIDKIQILANYFDIKKSDLVEDKSKINIDNKRAYPILGTVKAGYNYLATENHIGYINIDKKSTNVDKKEGADLVFETYMKEHYPYLMKMDKPLTRQQAIQLKDDFGEEIVLEVFSDMDNHKPLLKKYRDAYKTARNWCSRRMPERKEVKDD